MDNVLNLTTDIDPMIKKKYVIKAFLKEVKTRGFQDIEVSVEKNENYNWKKQKPRGFGWYHTIDPKVAFKNVTKRLHVVMSDATKDLYFYK